MKKKKKTLGETVLVLIMGLVPIFMICIEMLFNIELFKTNTDFIIANIFSIIGLLIISVILGKDKLKTGLLIFNIVLIALYACIPLIRTKHREPKCSNAICEKDKTCTKGEKIKCTYINVENEKETIFCPCNND